MYLHKCVWGKCGGVFVLAGNNNKYYYLSYNKKVIETANGLLCHCVFVCVCVSFLSIG